MRDSCIWCFNADILNFKYFICTPRKKKNEDTHSCGINGIAEKKGLAGYHFNRTVRVQWFFLVIFIWGFYVCASWFKGTLNHLGWGVVDYAFNQVAGLGKVAGRATRASALGPRMFCLSFESALYKKKRAKSHFHLLLRWNKLWLRCQRGRESILQCTGLLVLQNYCRIFRLFMMHTSLLVSKEWNWADLLVIKISSPYRICFEKAFRGLEECSGLCPSSHLIRFLYVA